MLHPYVSMLLIVRAGGSGCRRKRKRRTTTTAMKKRRKRTALQIKCEEQRYPGTSSCSVVKALWLSEWSQWSDVMTFCEQVNLTLEDLEAFHWMPLVLRRRKKRRRKKRKRTKAKRRRRRHRAANEGRHWAAHKKNRLYCVWSREGHRRRPYDLILVPLELPEPPGKVREKREEREEGWNWHVLRCYQVTIIIYN